MFALLFVLGLLLIVAALSVVIYLSSDKQYKEMSTGVCVGIVCLLVIILGAMVIDISLSRRPVKCQQKVITIYPNGTQDTTMTTKKIFVTNKEYAEYN